MKIRSLILLITAFMLAFISCNKALPEPDRYTFRYDYSNETEYVIKVKAFVDKQLNAEYKLTPFTDSAFTAGIGLLNSVEIPIPFYYRQEPSYYQQADSIYLQFSDDRFIIYRKGDSIYMYQAYEKTRFGDTLVIYQYYFTEEDYNNATPIK